MKKIFFFLAAVAMAITASAKVTTISPDAENDALRLAVHYAEDGDIIEMTEGTYVQCNNGYVAFDGKAVTVRAAEGANVVLQLQVPITIANGGKATLQGIKIDASRLTELADWYEHVIYATDATEGKELVMDGCELYGFNINKSAIYSSSSNTLALCDVKNCYFHDNMKSCIFFEGESLGELSVTNSTVANIATDATGYYAGVIDVRNAAAKVTVDHCTFYNCLLMNTDYAAVTMKGPQSANVVISNNIFMLPEAIDGHRAIRNDVEATNCMTFNYVKDNGGIHSSVTKTNCFLNVDPMFVDAANGNFALAEGSPALAAATDGSDLGDPRWNVPAGPEFDLELPVEISNLTTSEMVVEGKTILQLTGSNDNEGVELMLFIPDYTGEDKEYALDVNSYLLTLGGTELTLVEGALTKSTDDEKGDVFAGRLVVTAEEDGQLMTVALDLTMWATPPVEIEIEDVTITVDEESAIALFATTWEGTPLSVEVSGFAEAEFTEYPECWLTIGDDVNWVDAAVGPVTVIIEEGVATLEGEFTSFATGKTYNVMLTGNMPVKEEPVVEPTYTENKLNTYAFGLESVLNDTALVVTYRLNNSNATSVDVVVLRGDKVVATVPGTTTIGVNTVAVPTAILPQGFQLTWKVVVKGTSVEAPTQEEKIYSFYHPSAVDVDNNPENPTFGMLLVNEAMQSVKDVATGYVSSNFGAGIFAFTPSFDLMPNGENPGYNGGKTFSTVKNDFAPRRIRISKEGRIFATAQDGSGEYLWEINPENLNEWTTVFQGTNDGYALKDAEGNFIAGSNSGFDVRGEGENLQLLMLSSSLPGAQVGSFKCHTYDLGTATTWATVPTKEIPGANYMLVTNQSNVQFDKDGGVWYIQYRGTTTETEPGLVHINKDGVEDLKVLRNYARNAGFRFTPDFSKVVIAGTTNGDANPKKATVYAVSVDENGVPVLTEEVVIDMAAVGNNLNDFAWDYAGNLYACGNSSEKLAAWAMPYSGVVETPAASKYAFHLGNLLEKAEMTGVVKRALTVGESTVVLTHEADGTANLYNVIDGEAYKVSQEGVVPVDPENKGSYLAISDIAVTEDGKLVANNYVRCQFAGTAPEDGYKLGTSYYYIWDDLTGAPRVWFTSQATARSSHGDMGKTFAVKGTSTDAKVLVTAVHNNNRAVRMALYSIIDGVYEEPDIANGTYNNDYYFNFGLHTTANYYKEATQGKEFYLLASPLADASWIIEGELSEPSEFLVPAEVGADYAANQEIAVGTLGNKYQGTSVVTVGEQVLMVAPYADAEGKLAGVKVLDITAGLDAATEVAVADLDAAVEATAAATAVQVVEGGLVVTLVVDATIQTMTVELKSEPDYMEMEDEVTDLMIDTEYMTLAGTSNNFGFELYLTMGQDNLDGTFTLDPENSFVTFNGMDANFIEGYVYDIDFSAPAATALTKIELDGQYYAITFYMSNKPVEAIDIVIEDAIVAIDTVPLFGDVVDYALTMTANWTNPADGVTYPVLVEVPVYYPEATEPSEIMCTVTVGGMGDTDPWLGFGEGTLTVTTVGDVVTVAGLVENTWLGFAANVTISGKLPNPGSSVEDIHVNAETVKTIKNGQLIIIKNGKEYNVLGATVQ